jgi:hypothetical protein
MNVEALSSDYKAPATVPDVSTAYIKVVTEDRAPKVQEKVDALSQIEGGEVLIQHAVAKFLLTQAQVEGKLPPEHRRAATAAKVNYMLRKNVSLATQMKAYAEAGLEDELAAYQSWQLTEEWSHLHNRKLEESKGNLDGPPGARNPVSIETKVPSSDNTVMEKLLALLDQLIDQRGEVLGLDVVKDLNDLKREMVEGEGISLSIR